MNTRLRQAGWLLAAMAGAVALVVSMLLHTSPSTVQVRVGGHLEQLPGTMSTADYVVIALRIAGVVLLLAGAYLAYRRLRPEAAPTDAGGSGRFERPLGAHPEAGTHTSRPAGGLWGRGP